MARSGTRTPALCHKLLPVAISLALLLAASQTLAQSTSASADININGGSSGSSSGGSSGGIIGAAAGAINGGIAGAKAGAQSGQEGGSSSSAQVSGNIGGGMSASASGSSSSDSSSSASASASISFTSTPKPEGLLSKMKDMVKSGVESLTHDDKSQASASISMGSESGSSSGGGGLISKIKESAKEMKEDVKSMFKGEEHGASGQVRMGSASASANIQMGTSGKEGAMSKFVHKVEDKASEVGDKLKEPFKHANEDKSLAVEMLDKSHDAMKDPLEKVLKPIDKALGYEKDPLIKMYDAGHEKLRHPVAIITKPVESVFSGAFKTTEETKRELSEQQKRELRMREERMRKEGRTILGEITDKSVEMLEKPIEIILRPVDRMLGLDKDGKKNPLIQLIDEIYGFSKKPIDALARPFENILRKMAESDQGYQVSVRFNADSSDPKLFTRLADGALNIADRVITRPIEFAMRPLVGRKNPLVDAAHSLKNATKLGVELFTKPVDRIIKEIADIGAIKDENEREAEMERKRQEASRIVHALDKLHEIAQTPWEIVLRPVGKALGYNKEGRKEPLLRAWDVLHQVVRTPIQVLSKPWEDAILGEVKRPINQKYTAKVEARVGKSEEKKKNFFVEQIRKIEKLAAKPFDAITSPIRRLILGEDANGSRASASAKVGGIQAKVTAGSANGPDKIVKTIESMNNLVLKPLEVITQPISDILMSDSKQPKKLDVKVQSQASAGRGQASASAQLKSG